MDIRRIYCLLMYFLGGLLSMLICWLYFQVGFKIRNNVVERCVYQESVEIHVLFITVGVHYNYDI